MTRSQRPLASTCRSPADIALGAARRLALERALLLDPAAGGLPRRATGRGQRARKAAHLIIDRFGYLQLDTVSIAGARSHTLVLLSRLAGFDPALGEELLVPGSPLFEYWGHEASWIPLELYPLFEFRRRAHHPWWGDVVSKHRDVATRLLERIRAEGPLRSAEMEGEGSRGWWQLKAARQVAAALWSTGVLAIRERRGFQRSFDLTERVIPASFRAHPATRAESFRALLLKALDGHGWATRATLAATWRLRPRSDVDRALGELHEAGLAIPCDAVGEDGKRTPGWVRPEHLERAAALARLRPRGDRGVLLSPFDPILWDRARVRQLFGFDQVLEIFKPAGRRRYGYYCLPVLAGERLVARLDLAADRKRGRVRVLHAHHEQARRSPGSAADREAVRVALARHAEALGLAADAVPAGPG